MLTSKECTNCIMSYSKTFCYASKSYTITKKKSNVSQLYDIIPLSEVKNMYISLAALSLM